MTEEQIDRLRDKYLPLGIVWGSSFVLPPTVALSLLREFAKMGVVVVGYDQWRYFDRSKGLIMELLWSDGVKDDRVASVTAEEGAAIVEDLLVNHLPPETELVSFLYRDFWADDWFSGWKQSE